MGDNEHGGNMGFFDSIIGTAAQQTGIGSSAASGLVSALISHIAGPAYGGLAGFLDMFRHNGMGDLVDSWVSTGANKPLTENQIEASIGDGVVSELSKKAGIGAPQGKAALAFIIPMLVDKLTPTGSIPDKNSFLSTVGEYITGAPRAATATAARVVDRAEDTSGSFLKWLLPLLLLGLLLALGFWFCGRGAPVANVNTNVNVNRPVVGANMANVANTVSNTISNAVNAAVTKAVRALTEVVLPNGTKLQAYPGGIEDQLVKFIQSDDYKNGTNDTLKDKWFNFDDLNFVFGKTELTPESKRQLDNITAILKAYPTVKIKIGGYTDKKGEDAANKKLSDDRAKAVQAALQKAGVGAQVPEAEGYGEQFAKVEESASDEAREVDRRTSVRLIK